jgi:DNA-binding transcriptional ArsR family regulator
MLNYSDIDDILKALVEPTRRQIVERLSRGPASVSELARPFDMSLAAIVQHLQVLEESGLIRSEKIGRVRTCRIEPSGLDRIAGWVAERRSLMERRFDRLGEMLSQPAVNNQIDNQQEEKE